MTPTFANLITVAQYLLCLFGVVIASTLAFATPRKTGDIQELAQWLLAIFILIVISFHAETWGCWLNTSLCL